jgi:HEAT repeat protein
MSRGVSPFFVLAGLSACGPSSAGEGKWAETIRALLDLPAPVEDWRDHAPYRKSPPPEDAPLEVLAAWWSRAADGEDGGPRPSEKVEERLLAAAIDSPRDLASLLRWIPKSPGSISAVKRLRDSAGGRMPGWWKDVVAAWLEETKSLFGEGLLQAALEARYEDDSVIGEAALRALLRRDRKKGLEVLEKHRKGDDETLATFALCLLHDDTLEHGGAADEERRELCAIAGDPGKTAFARGMAARTLSRKHWEGRDAWFLDLFRDESLRDVRYLFSPLADAVEADPDHFIPLVVPLVGDGSREVHDTAVDCLARLHRADALLPLIPWLGDPEWSSARDRLRFIGSLGSVKVPGCVPGLIEVLRAERDFGREAAVRALAFQADRAVVPALREVLDSEDEEEMRGTIAAALLALFSNGGWGDDGQVIIRLKAGKAELLERIDEERYRRRNLTGDAWRGLGKLIDDTKFFALPPLLLDVMDGIDYEAIDLLPGDVRSVFMMEPGISGSAASPYHLLVRRFARLKEENVLPPRYEIEDLLPGARVVLREIGAEAVREEDPGLVVQVRTDDDEGEKVWRKVERDRLGPEIPPPDEPIPPYQPTGMPGERWDVLPGDGDTEVGPYDTKTFRFKWTVKFPHLRFEKDRMWVDAANRVVYVVAHGDLLSLPLGR